MDELEQTTKEQEQDLGLFQIFKKIYGKNQYLFLAINLICFFVIFFILDESKGGIIFRISIYLFGSLLGGFIGKYIVSQNSQSIDTLIKGFRKGAAIGLILITLSVYEKTDDSSNSESLTNTSIQESSDSNESSSEVCPHCDGAGERINNVSGVYGICATCNGKGIVSKNSNYVKSY